MSDLPHSCIITGAAGGIGRAVSLSLAKAGINLVLTDRNVEQLRLLEKDAAGLPGRMVGLPGDMLDADLAEKLCDHARDAFGGIDLLINCSGFLEDARVEKMPVELFRKLIDINLIAPMRLADAVTPTMRDAGFGRIISLSSRAWLGNFGSAGYSSAKGGVVGFSRSRALALAQYGITVNCIAPGFIDTPMARSLPPHIMERVLRSIPVGRAGTVDDITSLILFLASRGSGYITGQTFVACGGRSIGSPISGA
ncbi:SDR family oxidoreductase [Xanthobacter sp. DSM 24535]|uniref:SDR family NAD(P)-dependent oxidoreductase n=1 Tax=Roseixanthobacter psychrophilus TaxID=3119917 RepID=UPI00372AF03B